MNRLWSKNKTPRIMQLNPYSRNQPGYCMQHMFPDRADGQCVCGCGQTLTGRQRRWASKACQDRALSLYWVVKGDSQEVRKQLYDRDKGICAHCGVDTYQDGCYKYEADHIVPVHRGGGGCDLDNFQTLCMPCHKAKTLRDIGTRKHYSRIPAPPKRQKPQQCRGLTDNPVISK